MKKVFLSAFFLPLATSGDLSSHHYQAGKVHSDPRGLAEIRSGAWPIIMEKDIDYPDTIYSIQFRDESVLTSVVMDTVSFYGVAQVKFLGKALMDLKNGSNGDIARSKSCTLTRADKKYEGTWYILRDKYSMTSFQQPEADIITKIIKGL